MKAQHGQIQTQTMDVHFRTNRVTLLTIPTEVRCLILAHVFADAQLDVSWVPTIPGPSEDCVFEYRSAQRQVLRLCRALSVEGKRVLEQQTTVNMDWEVTPPGSGYGTDLPEAVRLRLCRFTKLRLRACCGPSDFRRMRSFFPNLRDVELTQHPDAQNAAEPPDPGWFRGHFDLPLSTQVTVQATEASSSETVRRKRCGKRKWDEREVVHRLVGYVSCETISGVTTGTDRALPDRHDPVFLLLSFTGGGGPLRSPPRRVLT